ncbi:MAG: prepilin-type N-terminal cleavage/methylation domain-containing protein [Burkholderiales bacterium]|nr:prepilin-type N-terminal cleavage/methylation domain-containing protein [Burkholderiales bacterium]
MLNPRTWRARRQRGLSIVELLIGVAVGLIVVAGALNIFASHMTNTRTMILETRVIQDLRALNELVVRDLRRAGYWANAIDGTREIPGTGAGAANPYAALAADADADQVVYAFSRDEVENDTLDADEQFGFRFTAGAGGSAGTVEMQTADGTWQLLTNPALVDIVEFSIAPQETVIPLGHFCPTPCAPGAVNCPTVTVGRYDLVIRGRARGEPQIERELRSSVRVRNDRAAGVCPA